MRIKKGFTLRTVAGEQIVAGEGIEQINFNKLISLNATAAYLWQEVADKEFDARLLADLLTVKYHIPYEIALPDAQELVAAWIKSGLVEE